MPIDELERFEAPDRASWRAWLAANHDGADGVWLVFRKKGSGEASVAYDEAVEECLCFGWIDSKVRSLDEERYMQLMTPRKPGSTWSRPNKERVERLRAAGLMTEAGEGVIEAAEEDGSWTFLDPIEDLIVPDDLAEALAAYPEAAQAYEAFTASAKKGILFWIASAKRDQTRSRRIAETVRLAAEGRPANQPDG